METLTNIVNAINGVVWGPMMMVLILGVGSFLMLGLKLLPLFNVGKGFKLLWKGRVPEKGEENSGEIPPWQALMTALSATVGTGNIAGVATAVFIGGPGALFWMWCSALVGTATKFSEAVLAVKFREVDDNGNYHGGPMYYIKKGLDEKWAWLGTAFALFAALAAFGIGNTVQTNSVADVLNANFATPKWLTGLVMMILVGATLIGGLRRISAVASALVPFMAAVYIHAGLVVLALNAGAIPAAIDLVIHHAFTPVAASGGFAGATVWMALRFGVARGVFSNEAGMGSAPIAHAAAKTKDPVRQGTIAMLGTFIDTIIICSITGLVIIISGQWDSGISGAALTSEAFATLLPGGNYIVAFSLALFTFSTILGWSFYGERSIVFLFGKPSVKWYRIIFILVVPIGAIIDLEFVWLVADTLNAMMAIPNLIALGLLSPVVFRLVEERQLEL